MTAFCWRAAGTWTPSSSARRTGGPGGSTGRETRRGCQVVNVWLGGGLIQDLGPEQSPFHQREEGDQIHPVQAGRGSLLRRLYGPVFPVNSSHHQGLGRLGRGLRASAWWSDGTAEVIEAAEHESLPLLCVQFHPERMTGALARSDTVDGGALFRVFLELCKQRS